MKTQHMTVNNRSGPQTRHTLAALLMLTSAAHTPAAENLPKPMLRGYIDTLGGKHLRSGDYVAMVRQLKDGKSTKVALSYASMTNLCVGYIVSNQFDAARGACDTALETARQSVGEVPQWSLGIQTTGHSVALAYSNRAVLNWLSRDAAGALSDLERARSLAPKSDFVRANVAAMSSEAKPFARVAGKPSG